MWFLTRRRDLIDALLSSSLPHAEKVLKPLICGLTERCVPFLIHESALIDQSRNRGSTSSDSTALRQLLISPNLSSELLEHGCSTLVTSIFGGNEDEPLQELLSELYQRHPVEVRTAIREYAEENEDDGKDEDDLIASLSLVSWSFEFLCTRLTLLLSRSFLLAIRFRITSLCLRIMNRVFVLKVYESYSQVRLPPWKKE